MRSGELAVRRLIAGLLEVGRDDRLVGRPDAHRRPDSLDAGATTVDVRRLPGVVVAVETCGGRGRPRPESVPAVPERHAPGGDTVTERQAVDAPR